jgi:hypothetical protein
MNDIDKITLELFTNKTHYKKYLSKIEPDNYNEIKEFREKCIEYKHEILVKIEELLTTTTTNEFLNSQDPFFIFTSELIKEIERKKEVYFEEEEEESENYDDEDVLFPPDKMISSDLEEENKSEKYSFWGKERVIQQHANSDFISHYPTNTSVRRRFVGRRNSILPKNT